MFGNSEERSESKLVLPRALPAAPHPRQASQPSRVADLLGSAGVGYALIAGICMTDSWKEAMPGSGPERSFPSVADWRI